MRKFMRTSNQGVRVSEPVKAWRIAKVTGIIAAGLLLTNCAAPQKTTKASRSKEYFSSSQYGVAPSPRVIAEGQSVPKGGGRDMVGRPYTVAGRVYVPRENPNYTSVGTSSWYGSAFHGRLTANGEIYDKQSFTAAHPTMPLPSYARVTNLRNNYSMIVRVNDRGPYHGNRVIDVSQKVAETLDFKRHGTARVKVEYVGRASTRGSDDGMLMASLSTDGRPASVPGLGGSVQVASNDTSFVMPQVAAERDLPRQEARFEKSESEVPAESIAAAVALPEAPMPPARPSFSKPTPLPEIVSAHAESVKKEPLKVASIAATPVTSSIEPADTAEPDAVKPDAGVKSPFGMAAVPLPPQRPVTAPMAVTASKIEAPHGKEKPLGLKR
jgi:rare lipoprotein A